MIPSGLFGVLIPSVFLLPLLAAALCLVASRRPRVQNVITVITLTAVLVISGVLLVLTDQHGMHTVQVGGWDAPVGITLVADRLSALMLCVSAVVLLTVIIYAVGQGVRDGDGDGDQRQRRRQATATATAMATATTAMATRGAPA